mmetsp:Transcript_21304/g.54638  ORF Transcript_21304/g.54638 Transcript_21304/m.54638 type:complete len:90 (+) Transcript_21304:2673-2942(+)
MAAACACSGYTRDDGAAAMAAAQAGELQKARARRGSSPRARAGIKPIWERAPPGPALLRTYQEAEVPVLAQAASGMYVRQCSQAGRRRY